ncbi:cell division protein FtsQ/DivIB [Clostridium sp. Marseille-QA1073]
MLTSVLITLCLKLSYFNIASITVKGNENLTKEEIIEKSNIKVGENIFTVKTNKAISSVKENPYVITSHIKRKFPNEIIITVEERKAAFYSKLNDEFYIIDNEGIILDKEDHRKS